MIFRRNALPRGRAKDGRPPFRWRPFIICSEWSPVLQAIGFAGGPDLLFWAHDEGQRKNKQADTNFLRLDQKQILLSFDKGRIFRPRGNLRI